MVLLHGKLETVQTWLEELIPKREIHRKQHTETKIRYYTTRVKYIKAPSVRNESKELVKECEIHKIDKHAWRQDLTLKWELHQRKFWTNMKAQNGNAHTKLHWTFVENAKESRKGQHKFRCTCKYPPHASRRCKAKQSLSIKMSVKGRFA